MKKVLVSTGALIGRPNGRDFTLLHTLVPQLECDGLELLMYDTWYDKIGQLKSVISSLPLPTVVFHLEKQIGELISYSRLDEALERMEINCTLARDVGAAKLVLHLWNGPISDKNIDYNIKCFEYLNNIAKHFDLTLTVDRAIPIETNYGESTMHIMLDDCGNEFIWTTAAKVLTVGNQYNLRGTVKEHRVYRGKNQTILTRCAERK